MLSQQHQLLLELSFLCHPNADLQASNYLLTFQKPYLQFCLLYLQYYLLIEQQIVHFEYRILVVVTVQNNQLENVRVLNEVEEEKVSGGRGDGLPTIFNPGPDVTKGQKKDIVTDPANNLYPPLGRPLPFPQNRKDLTDLPCDDPFYTKAAAPTQPGQPFLPDYPDGPWVI